MDVRAVEKLVMGLSVAMTNAVLYFPEHRRVRDAVAALIAGFDAYFREEQVFVVGVQKVLLIFQGLPLYDLSVKAHRLADTIRARGGWGLRIARGVTADELLDAVRIIVTQRTSRPEEVNAVLGREGITRVALEEKPRQDVFVARARQREHVRRALEGSGGDGVEHVRIYTGALAALEEFIVRFREDQSHALEETERVAAGVVEGLAKDRDAMISLAAIKDYDSYTFNHSANVCIYVTALAESLTQDRDEMAAIAQAALLHDVGKVLIPEDVLFKMSALSSEEWSMMRRHPVLGAKILMEARHVDELAVNVAFGHHLRYDQRGYPELCAPMNVDPITHLVNVVDVYEAITASRPYKKPFPPEEAAEILLDGAGTEFNPACVESFVRTFGVYPPGTRVRLSDGSEAQVVSANPGDVTHPVVRVTHGPDGEPVQADDVTDTSRQDAGGRYHLEVVDSVYA